MDNMSKIIPRTLKGFHDYLPVEQIVRQKIIEIIKGVYERFGFLPLETPALEYAKTLFGKGGGENEKLSYHFKDQGGREIALRYDLTVPLARVIAQYRDIKKPFKRYQIGPVWRAEKPQKGRFREFYQCDADIVGVQSVLAEAEIIALISEILTALGVKKFLIKINNRKILNGFLESIDLEKKSALILRLIDKREKIGEKNMIQGLRELDIELKKTKEINQFIKTPIDNFDDLEKLKNKYPQITTGANELKELMESVSILISDKNICQIDLSLARGFDYYTGPVFEVCLADSIESIAGGGRFDQLISSFGAQNIPAVGIGFGLDRLFNALKGLRLVQEQKSTAKIMVAFLEKNLLNDYLKITREMRAQGLNTFFYFENIKLGKQLKFAADQGIKYVLIYGSREKEKDEIIIRNIFESKQKNIKIEKLKDYLIKIN